MTHRKWIVALCAASVLMLGNVARAQSAKEIVKKAITAHGGADGLKKYPAAKAIFKGKVSIMGLEVAMEGETTFQLPDMLKTSLKLDLGGMKIDVLQLYNAGKVRVTAAGMATPVSDAQKEEIKETLYLQSLQNLVSLLDKSVEISVIESPDKVKGKEVDGILVKSKDHKEVKMFFDKKSNVLVKMERMGLNEAEKVVKQEMFFHDHKKVDGILRAVKSDLIMDGKTFMESEITDWKNLDKVDKKEFDIAD